MLETHIIEQINNKLLDILNIQNNDWNKLTEQEKIRVLHRLLATINKKESKNVIIPLQNSKPKKIILSYCGFNKKTEMYKKYISLLTGAVAITEPSVRHDRRPRHHPDSL